MREEVTDNRWLADFTAGLERPGELGDRAQEATALYLSRCTAAQAAALKADLTAEKAKMTSMLMRIQSTGAMSAIARRQEIVDGSLRAFEA